jgi:hypothetical protein
MDLPNELWNECGNFMPFTFLYQNQNGRSALGIFIDVKMKQVVKTQTLN